MAGELIRTGDAAAILGTSRQHIVDLCNRGLLPFERSPKQRRLRRSEVEAFARQSSAPPALTRAQRQSLWLHAAVAGQLVANPSGTLQRARLNLARLRRTHPSGVSSRWFDRWEVVLDGDPAAVLETLTSTSPLATELRQNSPFAGVLSDAERTIVLQAFRAHERGTTT